MKSKLKQWKSKFLNFSSLACKESYNNPNEISACNFGCSSVKSTKNLCDATEYQLPQITYSVLIEESDVLIHPGKCF